MEVQLKLAYYHTHLQLDLGVSLLTLATSCALGQKRKTRQKKPFITVFNFHFKELR